MNETEIKQLTDDLKLIVGKNICKYRNMRGYTQEMLAEYLNCSVVYISMIENGHYGVGFRMLALISKFLNIKTSQLFED